MCRYKSCVVRTRARIATVPQKTTTPTAVANSVGPRIEKTVNGDEPIDGPSRQNFDEESVEDYLALSANAAGATNELATKAPPRTTTMAIATKIAFMIVSDVKERMRRKRTRQVIMT
jgi:hypothetical protein